MLWIQNWFFTSSSEKHLFWKKLWLVKSLSILTFYCMLFALSSLSKFRFFDKIFVHNLASQFHMLFLLRFFKKFNWCSKFFLFHQRQHHKGSIFIYVNILNAFIVLHCWSFSLSDKAVSFFISFTAFYLDRMSNLFLKRVLLSKVVEWLFLKSPISLLMRTRAIVFIQTNNICRILVRLNWLWSFWWSDYAWWSNLSIINL